MIYKVLGKGEPIVMIHGWAMSSEIWIDLAKKIAKTQQVFLIDLPGMGSNKNTQFIDIDQTISEINALNLSHFSIMGWSFGGQIALHYSYINPKKIKKLFLVSTTPCFVNQIGDWQSGVDANIFNKFANDLIADWQTTMERFLNLQLLGSEYRKTILKKLMPLFLKTAPDIDSLKKSLNFLLQNDLRYMLPKIDIPTMIMTGNLDKLVPIEASEYLNKKIKLSKIKIFKGATHLPFLSHMDDFMNTFQEFNENYDK
jgi:pimeloyl-[acyl-carrier protein] methyl ester esterase